MVKLYYTSTSCGAASFIAAHKAGLGHIQTEQVDIRSHKTNSGADYYTINPKGNVPSLVLDDGTVLNENVAVLSYIGDQSPAQLSFPHGSSQYYLLQSILAYLASEVHPSMGGLFYPNVKEVKDMLLERLAKKLTYVNDQLVNGKQFLIGDRFTVADSYLYIILSWAGYLGVDLAPYANVKKYFEGIGSLEFVQAAHKRMAENPSSIL